MLKILNIKELLIVTTLVFFIGVFGIVFNRKNIIVIIMSIELVLLSVNLNFIIFSLYLDDIIGEIFTIFILAIAAVESAIGLSLLVAFYKLTNSIRIKTIKTSKN